MIKICVATLWVSTCKGHVTLCYYRFRVIATSIPIITLPINILFYSNIILLVIPDSLLLSTIININIVLKQVFELALFYHQNAHGLVLAMIV